MKIAHFMGNFIRYILLRNNEYYIIIFIII
jgi:hypothetical protein